MITSLFDAHMTPFTIALGLLFGLMLLELVSALLGGSLLGLGGDADADFDLDADVDVDLDFDPEFDAEFDLGADAALEDLDIAPTASASAAQWLGMGRVPFLIWLASALLGFGLGGVILQTGVQSLLGFALPATLAAVIMAPLGVGFARSFSGVFARVLPKSETTALSENHLGRRQGIVSRGTAARGKPAEVRVVDGYGNTHYLRAEPLRDDQEIAQGARVLVLRKSRDEGYRLVTLDD